MSGAKANGAVGASGLDAMQIDDDLSFPLSHFSIPEHYAADLNSVMIPHGLIMDRIEKLAVDILHAYKFKTHGTRLHMVCVLKGGHQFFSDLCNCLKQLTLTGVSEPPLTFDFIRVKSYAGTESTGDVRIDSVGLELSELRGRHVLLCEDIIDTGTTMSSARASPATPLSCLGPRLTSDLGSPRPWCSSGRRARSRDRWLSHPTGPVSPALSSIQSSCPNSRRRVR